MVFVGTSGYSFPDWDEVFYPSGTRGEDRLQYYVNHFPVVELNTTYYRLPSEKMIGGMARATPDGFKFAIKANQLTTHRRDRTAARPFLDALQPMREAGKLAAVLFQFPFAFRNNETSRRYLWELSQDFREVPGVVEFRHDSWIKAAAFEFISQLGLGFCCVDEPRLPGLVPPVARVTSPIGYIRFHSRDRSKWFGGDSQQRYNYRYSKEELQEWLPKLAQFKESPGVESIFVFFNNCHAGHAAVNALEFEKMLKEMGMV